MAKHDLGGALDLAERLATFANLTPDDAAAFRKRYPHFAPDAWWDNRVWNAANGVVFVWTEEQKRVRVAWQTGFSPDDCIALIAAGAKTADWEADIKAHQAAGEAGLLVEGAEAEGAEFFHKHEQRQRRIFDYQRAVMFLHIQQWRASRCEREECRKYCVKDAKGRRYCSKTCFDINRIADKLKCWRDRGSKQRAAKNKAKKNRTRK
jgi:hypothetical protein